MRSAAGVGDSGRSGRKSWGGEGIFSSESARIASTLLRDTPRINLRCARLPPLFSMDAALRYTAINLSPI